jgi:spermidine synthase
MSLRRRLWNPYALVFISSFCVMTIELVATRLVAPRVGVSIFIWTSVIGIILAGISLGNYIGGRLADRHASPTLLGVVFAAAALASLFILWLNNDLHDVYPPFHLPLMFWVVLYIAGVFSTPAVLLGCVSPIIVKLSLTDLARTGSTVGRIYAWSALGSIAGTFATGFFLIGWLGTKGTVTAAAALLLALGLWFLTDARPARALLRGGVALGLFAGMALWLRAGGFTRSECMLETDYFCINVYETRRDGRTIHELWLDRLMHSYTDLADPTYLVYDYERTYAGVIAPLLDERPHIDALFVGGGGYTFPRYMRAMGGSGRMVVAEIDPGVTEAAHEWLGLPRDTDIETHNMDARHYLARLARADSYDVVFGDAFNDYSVPYHLTTREFALLVDEVLRDDGLYVANIIDGGRHGRFLRAYVHTLQGVFSHVTVIPSSMTWREAARMTFVVVAGHRPADLLQLPAEYRPLSAAELGEYMALAPPAVLTDDHVPVDGLLAPVLEDSFAEFAFTPEMMQLIGERLRVVGAGVVTILLATGAWRLRRRRRRAVAPGPEHL